MSDVKPSLFELVFGLLPRLTPASHAVGNSGVAKGRPAKVDALGRTFIELSQGLVAFIDPEDAAALTQRKWSAFKTKNKTYAGRRVTKGGQRHLILMHRWLMGEPDGDVDHRNGDGLDNRRDNLRAATRSENTHNSVAVYGLVRYRGVWFVPKDRCFKAEVQIDGRRVYLGRFSTAEEASAAYEARRLKLTGEFYPIRR